MDDPKAKKNTSGLSQRNQYIVVGVLAAAFAGLLIYRYAGSGSVTAEAAVRADDAPGQLAPLPQPCPVPPEPAAIERGKALTHDPFRISGALKDLLEEQATPGNEQNGGQPPGPDPAIIAQGRLLALKGIMGDAKGRIAFINDSPVQAGDTIDGFDVLEVRELSVLLRKEETDVELQLPDAARKREAPAPSKPPKPDEAPAKTQKAPAKLEPTPAPAPLTLEPPPTENTEQKK